MAMLLRRLRPSLPARLMASRLFSSPSLKNHNFISPLSLSGLFLYPRKDAGIVRAFMSSSHDDKAFEGMDVAAADSSEQTKDYFVDIGSWGNLEPDDPKLFEATHIDILASLLGSKEAALKSIMSSYEGVPRFLANLTRSQAKSLAEFPGVALVEEDRDLRVHWGQPLSKDFFCCSLGLKFVGCLPTKVANGEKAEIDDIGVIQDGDNLFLLENDSDIMDSN